MLFSNIKTTNKPRQTWWMITLGTNIPSKIPQLIQFYVTKALFTD